MLLGLTLWGIGAARRTARLSASLAKLKQHATVFTAYSNDYRGLWPYFVNAGVDAQSIPFSGGVYTSQEYFEGVNAGWRYALAESYYGGAVQSEVFLDYADVKQPLPFVYGCAFAASPEYWSTTTRTGRQQWRATRVDEVAQPGKKTMLLGFGLMGAGAGNARASAGYCDAHAGEDKATAYLPGMPSGDGLGSMWHSFDLWVGLHTLEGLRGSDVR